MDHLPSKWKYKAHLKDFVVSDDQLCLKRISDKTPVLLYANKKVKVPDDYYFEVQLVAGNNAFALGFSPIMPDDEESNLVWPCNLSFTYHGDTGKIWHNEIGTVCATPLNINDVLGCGKKKDGSVFFTVNGEYFETTFKLSLKKASYLIIALRGEGTEVKTNFGNSSFMYHLNCKLSSSCLVPTTLAEELKIEANSSSNSKDCIIDDHLSDIAIVSKDQYTIRCHRLILSIRSKVFKQMLHANKNIKSTIYIEDFAATTIRIMIRFIYTDNLDESEIDMDLLSIANVYDIKSLQTVCENKLCKELDVENVLDAWLGAELLQCCNFLSCCEAYLIKNWMKVQKTEAFQRLSKEMPSKMLTLTLKMLEEKYRQ